MERFVFPESEIVECIDPVTIRVKAPKDFPSIGYFGVVISEQLFIAIPHHHNETWMIAPIPEGAGSKAPTFHVGDPVRATILPGSSFPARVGRIVTGFDGHPPVVLTR